MRTLEPWPWWPIVGPDGPRDVDDPSFDIAAVLWTDREPLRAAFDKSLTMLERLTHIVRGVPTIAGADELVGTAERLLAVGPDVLRAVWSDPRAYWWTRTAHGLVQGALSDPSGADDLDAHLAQLKLFAVGAAHLGGIAWIFDSPLLVAAGTRVPGTSLVIDAPHEVSITAVVGGQVHTEHGVVPLRSSPAARHGDFELVLDASTFDVPGYEKAETVVAAGEAYQEHHVGLVAAALGNIAKYAPDAFSRLREVIHAAALKPLDAGGFDDFSNPELPGSFIASVVENPLELGDHIVHELQHNCLSLVEESGELFTVDGDGSTIYYSPWRAKPRGLYGLLHGVYVFIALWRYWCNAAQDDSLDPASRAYALDRVVRIPEQLTVGVGVLERYAQLTALGEAVLDELRRDVAAITAELDALDFPADPPAFSLTPDGTYTAMISERDGTPLTARGAVREHVVLHDSEGRATGLLDQ